MVAREFSQQPTRLPIHGCRKLNTYSVRCKVFWLPSDCKFTHAAHRRELRKSTLYWYYSRPLHSQIDRMYSVVFVYMYARFPAAEAARRSQGYPKQARSWRRYPRRRTTFELASTGLHPATKMRRNRATLPSRPIGIEILAAKQTARHPTRLLFPHLYNPRAVEKGSAYVITKAKVFKYSKG